MSLLLAAAPGHALTGVERLIAEEPAALFDPASVLTSVEVQRWPLRTAADLEGWTVRDATVSQGAAGLLLQRTGAHPRLERQVALEAATIDAFRIEGVGGDGGTKVFWAAAGEPFAPARSAESVQRGKKRRAAADEVTVAAAPGWAGQIVRLRVDLVGAPTAELPVSGVVALRYRPDPRRWERVIRTPWKVELHGGDAGDLRRAWLAPRGAPISREIDGGAAVRLTVDYGVLGRVTGPLCFHVRALSGGVPPRTLFRRCVDRGEENTWRSAAIDLSGVGAGARVLFGTSGESGAALPVWGNPEIERPGAPERPNLVVISIDTLRADHLGLYGYRRATSPHLDEWARTRAVAFDTAIAAAPWTLPSHVAMLTGLSAFGHGVNYVDPAPGQLQTVAEILAAAGYSTLAVTGGGYLAPWVGLHQGFDRFAYWRHRRGAREAAEIATNVDLARAWLREQGQRPFFLFFHTYEVHAPYLPREPYFTRFNESARALPAPGVGQSGSGLAAESGFVSIFRPILGRPSRERPTGDGLLPSADLPLLEALYDAGIAYADQEIARLLATLTELGLDRRTLVIVTSDHGEALGERGLAGHAYLFDFNLRVPLLVALPGGEHAGTHVSAQVQSVDIVPTALDVLGVPTPDGLDGRSLVPLLSAPPPASQPAWSYAAQSNHGIALRLEQGVKYVFNNDAWLPPTGREQLLRIDAASGEEREITDETQLRTMRRALLDHYASDGPRALTVTVVNHFDGALRGRIAAAALRPMQVKTLEPPPVPLRWAGGGCEWVVPPGGRLTLLLEGTFGPELTLAADADIGAPRVHARQQLRLDQITLPSALRLAAGTPAAWAAGGLASEATGIELTWRGRGVTVAPATAVAMPDEVREQLRALGY